MKPTVYVGLGGTGLKAIAHTKKMFEEQYGVGNIPPEIAFLAVDFDKGEPNKPDIATDITTDFLQLQSNINPRKFYDTNRDQLPWLFGGNVSFLAERIGNGASQVRTTGRLYTELVIKQFRNALDAAIANVTHIANQAEGASETDIYMVFSMAGGTGAGSFLTLAQDTYVKKRDKVKIYAYGVIHGIFETVDVSGRLTLRVFSNAYSALLDVDYLLHASDENPVPFMIDRRTEKITAPVFEEFYLINNVTDRGETIKTIDDLCKVVGTSLFVSSGDVGAANVAVGNNISWKKGTYNVHNKQGWVYGLGACSVVYKGKLLAEIYGIKAAIELIRRMQQEDAEVYGKALTWTEEVGIREDNINDGNMPHDMLIDSIYSKADIARLPECPVDYRDSDANISTTLNSYLSRYVNFPSTNDLKTRAEDLKTRLRERILLMLNAENGVGNATIFVTELKKHCESFRTEMSNEREKLETEILGMQESLFSQKLRAYEAKRQTFTYRFLSANSKQELIEEYLGNPATDILRAKHEAKRREAAYGIFITLLAEIDFMLEKLSTLNRKLSNLKDDYIQELSDKQTSVQSSLVFEYDLSAGERNNVKLNVAEVNVDSFVNGLSATLLDIDVNENLKKSIEQYTSALPKAQEYRNRRIVDVVNGLNEEKYKELKEKVEKLSGTLLSYDDPGLYTVHGDHVCDAIAKSYRILLNAKKDDYIRMEADTDFLRYRGLKPEWLKSEKMNHQKMIFCRTEGSIIPYCLAAFPSHYIDSKYEDLIKMVAGGAETFIPHYDKVLFDEMRRKDFKLKPEMKNEALFYWVCGHFFGWQVTPEEEREMERDPNTGEIIKEGTTQYVEHLKFVRFRKKKYEYCYPDGNDVEWQLLDNTSVRDKAFNYFKTVVLPEQKEVFNAKIKELYRGRVLYWQAEIRRVAQAGIDEYINKLVCNDKNSITYRGKQEYNLVREEFKYICNDLIAALDNLK